MGRLCLDDLEKDMLQMIHQINANVAGDDIQELRENNRILKAKNEEWIKKYEDLKEKYKDKLNHSNIIRLNDLPYELNINKPVMSARSRKKLLIFDVNGVLAEIFRCTRDITNFTTDPVDTYIYKDFSGSAHDDNESESDDVVDKCLSKQPLFLVYERPFVYEFLKFCIDGFDVAIWSSKEISVIKVVLSHILSPHQMESYLKFIWDGSYCTERRIVLADGNRRRFYFKELKTAWKEFELYDESNTLLLDDSPFKALLNPEHTGIFPFTYKHHQHANDDFLGPHGALRKYLQNLAEVSDVRKYVKEHPLGQKMNYKNEFS